MVCELSSVNSDILWTELFGSVFRGKKRKCELTQYDTTLHWLQTFPAPSFLHEAHSVGMAVGAKERSGHLIVESRHEAKKTLHPELRSISRN